MLWQLFSAELPKVFGALSDTVHYIILCQTRGSAFSECELSYSPCDLAEEQGTHSRKITFGDVTFDAN